MNSVNQQDAVIGAQASDIPSDSKLNRYLVALKDSSINITDVNETACPFQSLISFNLTSSKFFFLPFNDSYALYNCTEKAASERTPFEAIGPINCLGSENNLVYIIYSEYLMEEMPPSCRKSRTVEIPGGLPLQDVATTARARPVDSPLPHCSASGICSEGNRRALIYEFMPNGSLEKFIFSKTNSSSHRQLSWEKLRKIAFGFARGVEYLHQGCNQRILHFDIKPHNILLDHNFQPKISDFGLAKLCSKDISIVSLTAARGTSGYIAPELFSRNFGEISYKSDVYSYGMMLLEMVGCRKNNDPAVEIQSQIYFPEWIYNRMRQGQELCLDFEEDGDEGIARKLAIVAIWCIQWNPTERPSMPIVLQMLEADLQSLEIPPMPFVSADVEAGAIN
ncbi:protein kinase domain-containing protein [Citrus sinensis]|nr:protein kinase domain-containing protein [Citrus sinensis]